jgi:hypothetical protein
LIVQKTIAKRDCLLEMSVEQFMKICALKDPWDGLAPFLSDGAVIVRNFLQESNPKGDLLVIFIRLWILSLKSPLSFKQIIFLFVAKRILFECFAPNESFREWVCSKRIVSRMGLLKTNRFENRFAQNESFREKVSRYESYPHLLSLNF